MYFKDHSQGNILREYNLIKTITKCKTRKKILLISTYSVNDFLKMYLYYKI